jgi:hypothetical protein
MFFLTRFVNHNNYKRRFCVRFMLLQIVFASFLFPGINLFANDLFIVLLIDGSLSMNRTDPEEYRKLASQALLTLLEPDDNIAVVQFADRAEILLPWTKRRNLSSLYQGIERIGSVGTTDFFLGFQKTLELFEDVPDDARKIIFLFSDGELSPFPYSSEYSPLHLEYRRLIAGKSRPEVYRIYNEYRHRLVPIARTKIDTQILPVLRSKGIEIYSIAFSDEADQDFMRYLSDKTTLNENELRYFFVEHPEDLVETFLSLLSYWQNKILLFSSIGTNERKGAENILIDEFLNNVYIIAISDAPSELSFKVQTDTLVTFDKVPGTHPNLNIINLEHLNESIDLVYELQGSYTKYKLLVIAESVLEIEVLNLKPRYSFAEQLHANIFLKLGNQDARPFLENYEVSILAEIFLDNNGLVHETIYLTESDSGYDLNFRFPNSGNYTLTLTLNISDGASNSLLTRPSRKFNIFVMPEIFIEPLHVPFGKLKRGEMTITEITVHNSFDTSRYLDWTNVITSKSRDTDFESFISLSGSKAIPASSIASVPIELIIPEGKTWGHFEGIILLKTDYGETFEVTYSVHIPSWIEYAGLIVFILVLILLALLTTILVMWSNLKTPVGVLRPVRYPTGTLPDDIKLGRLKSGFWKRHLNWKKNEIILGSNKGNVKLLLSDSNLTAKLSFYHFGSDYIRNESLSADSVILLSPMKGVKIELHPGKSYSLINGLKIDIGEYTYLYEYYT